MEKSLVIQLHQGLQNFRPNWAEVKFSITKGDDPMKCKFCGKEISAKNQIEYSAFLTAIYCSTICAISDYMEYLESKPVSYEEAIVLVGKNYEPKSTISAAKQ